MKEKIDEILLNLIESTKSDDLLWSVESDGRYKRRLNVKSEDDLTTFETTIEYKLSNGGFKLDDCSLFIRNKTLPNGMYYVSSYEHKESINSLRYLLMDKYCKGFKPSIKEVEDTLESINMGISKTNYRDNKIDKILGFIKWKK